jgi:hypothetical protein
MDTGPAEIFEDRFDSSRNFAQRGIIPCRILVRGLWYPTEICLEEYDILKKFVCRGY